MNIIMLHGFLGDKNVASALLKYIKDPKLSVKTLTLPGHDGVSLSNINSVSDFAGYVRTNSADFIGDPYIIVGFSLGGCIALKYAEQYKNDPNLRGVVAWASPVFGYLSSIEIVGKLLFTLIPQQMFVYIQNNKTLNSTFSHYGINIKNSKKYELVKIINIIKSTSDSNLTNDIKKLFIFHRYDSTVLAKNHTKLLSVEPKNAEIDVIPNIGHIPSKKTLELISVKLTEFCKTLDGY